MFTLTESPAGWTLTPHGGERVLGTFTTYGLAMSEVARRVNVVVADGSGPALLPETWQDVDGIAYAEPTGDGRDLTDVVWSWRDPAVSVLPLMLQTSTEVGHFGADLAGFIGEVHLDGTTPKASGFFYDIEAGRTFRDLLMDGRRFGVSIDGGEADVEWVCDQMSPDGWCESESAHYLALQIIGLTGTPFPAFERAAIELAPAATDAAPVPAAAPAAVAASAFPATPPRSFFEMAEPEFGDPLLVLQDDEGHYAVPLTITDDGHVFGHAAWWDQCHVGYSGVCVSPPSSPSGYSRAMLRPTFCDDGGSVLTCPLVVGCDHADLGLFAQEARDFYAHAGLAWADVVMSDGQFGPWFTGALRPDVTPEQLRVLRSSSVSGDWRDEGDGLDWIVGLTVNSPGFPIRAQALAASGIAMLPMARRRARVNEAGHVRSLVASAVVRRECHDCTGTARTASAGGDMAEVLDLLRKLDRRTRHLNHAEVDSLLARMR